MTGIGEMEDTWRGKVSNEIAMGGNYIPFAAQQAREYFAELASSCSSRSTAYRGIQPLA